MSAIQNVSATSTALQTASSARQGPLHLASATSKSTGTSSSTSDAGDITGEDFLTLLVSELKNQDPTQPTDPQAYVQQLVGVNSLQQLIAINKDLGG